MEYKSTVYIWDKQLMRQCNKIPVVKGRATMVHSLIGAYGLLSGVHTVSSKPASHKELCKAHGKAYIDFLRLVNKEENVTDKSKVAEEMIDKFGLGYDCPVLPRMYNFVRVIAGASLVAAEHLVDGKARRAINWCGGWHHAQKSESQGFCYINDIVLAIHKLLEKFNRVIYIDLDIHHGNGVEAAFVSDSRVMTLSFHLHEPGFYPCSGELQDIGKGEGHFYAVNVPLQAGLCDEGLIYVFNRVCEAVLPAFKPEAVVVQCGADGLSKDPLGHFSLTLRGLGQCVEQVLSWDLPTLFLGGGGYNLANASRLWAFLTSLILGKPIPNDIPEHKFFLAYGGGYSYELHISPGQREDLNTTQYLDSLIAVITENMRKIVRTEAIV